MENNSYKTIKQAAEAVYVVERSKFIAVIWHIPGADDAKTILKELHAAHPFATHICYAYIADAAGNAVKTSDDGEPKGTAGQPILEVIKNNRLRHVLLAVVRYFGGVKLGTGGLARAYANAAAEAVAKAGIMQMQQMQVVEATLNLSEGAKLKQLRCGLELSREFGLDVKVKFAAPDISALKNELNGILQREAEITELGAEWLPVQNG